MNFDDVPIGGGAGNNPFGGALPRGMTEFPEEEDVVVAVPKKPRAKPKPKPKPRPAPQPDPFEDSQPPPPEHPPPEDDRSNRLQRKLSQKALDMLGVSEGDRMLMGLQVEEKKNKPKTPRNRKGPPASLMNRLQKKSVRKPVEKAPPSNNDDWQPTPPAGPPPDSDNEAPSPAAKPRRRPAPAKPGPMAGDDAPIGGSAPPVSTSAFAANLEAAMGGGGDPFGAPPPKPAANLSGPLDKLLVDKMWKTRKEAAEKLKQEFKVADDVSSGEFSKYTSLFGKMAMDTNAAAQQASLEAIAVYCDRLERPEPAKEFAEPVLAGIVKKGLAGRPAVVAACKDICLQLIELKCLDEVIAALTPAAKDRQFKKALAAGEIVVDAFKDFGPHIIPLKVVKPWIGLLYSHVNNKVREQAPKLGAEIYRWLRDIWKDEVEQMEGKLKPAQIKELLAAFEAVPDGKPKPTRHIRGQKPKGGAKKGKGASRKDDEDDFDPMSLVEAKDIARELPKGWENDVFAPKWKDKKERLDELLALVKSPKIKISPRLEEVLRCLKKLFSDSNVAVVGLAARAVEGIANGTKKDFHDQARTFLPCLLDLLKEKKIGVTQPVNSCLDIFFKHCLTLNDILGSLEPAINNKVPKIRIESSAWIARALKADGKANTVSSGAKPLADMMLGIINDKEGPVRDNALQTIGYLAGICGQRTLHSALAKLEASDPKKHKKALKYAKEVGGDDDDGDAEEEEEAVEVKAPPRSRTPQRRRVPSKKPAKKRPGSKKPGSRPAAAKPNPASKAGGSKKASKAADPGEGETYIAPKLMDPESAKEKCGEIFEAEHLDELESKIWKNRLASCDAIIEKIDELGDGISGYASAVVALLNHKPGFKDSNAMVCAKLYEIAGKLASLSNDFDKAHAATVIPFLANKMSDRKVAGPGAEALTAFAEACGPKFIVGQLRKNMKTVRSPVAQAAIVSWAETCVAEFGVATVDAQYAIELAKEWMGSSNKKVRDASVKVLVAVYKQTGDILKEKILDGLKSATATEVQKALDAVPKDEVGKSAATRAVKGQEVAKAVDLDDLVPRVDISGRVGGKLLEKMGDKNWKLRKEALDEVAEILGESNHRIGPKDGGLFAALKLRLSDSNKNLIKQTLELVAEVANDMGPPVSKYSKYIVLSILTCLTDAKKHVVDAASNTLLVWLQQAGVSAVLKYVPKVLNDPKFKGREALLVPINKSLEESKEKVDMRDLVKPAVKCLQDRNAGVRAEAEKLMARVIKGAGYGAVKDEVSGLPKAAQLQIGPLLEKAREQAAAGDDDDEEDEPPAAAKRGKRASSKAKKSGRSRGGSPSPAPGPGPGRKGRKPARGGGLDAFSKKLGMQSSKSKKKAAAADDEEPILKMCDHSTKDRRVKLEARKLKGQFRHWAPDETEEMEETLRSYTSNSFHGMLFHKNDFQKYVKAIDLLVSQGLSNQREEIDSVLDLLLKWFAWRICDANTSVLLKTFDFLQQLFESMAEDELELHDGEAMQIVPFIINETLGNPKPVFKDKSKATLHTLCKIYPPAKIFNLLQDALKNKNKRVVSECLEEMGSMYQTVGLHVGGKPEKSLPEVARCVGSSDNGIRSSALSTLQKVYQTHGEKTWDYIGGKGGEKKCKLRLTAKQRDMITERFKRTKVTGADNGAAHEESKSSGLRRPQTSHANKKSSNRGSLVRPKTSIPGRRRSVRASPEPEPEPQPEPVFRGRASRRQPTYDEDEEDEYDNTSSKVDESVFDLEFDSIKVPSGLNKFGSRSQAARRAASPVAEPEEEYDDTASENAPSLLAKAQAAYLASNSLIADNPIKRALNALETDDEDEDMESIIGQIKVIESTKDEAQRIEAMRWIWQLIKKEGGPHIVQPHTDRLIQVLIVQIRLAFEPFEQGQGLRLRLCKYALNLMLEIFQEASIAEEMHVVTHEDLSRELLIHLVNIGDLTQNDAGRHVVKSLNILMLKALENADRTSSFHVLLKFLQQDETEAFKKLVVKCLLKITKALSSTIDSLNLHVIMKSLHEFFSAHRRGSVNRADTVMRTVRTTLNEIVKLKGQEVMQYLTMVEQRPGEEKPDIIFYIESMLAHQAPSDATPSPVAVEEPVKSPSETLQERMARLRAKQSAPAAVPEPIQQEEDLSEDTELADIFVKLHKKETTQNALKMLYKYQQEHPNADLSPYLSKTSQAFQGYISRGLKRVEAAEKKRLEEQEALSPPAPRSRHANSDSVSSSFSASSDFRSRLAQITKSPSSKLRIPSSATESRPSSSIPTPSNSSANPSPSSSSIEALRSRMQRIASTGSKPAPRPAKKSDADSSDALARIRARMQALQK